MGNLRLEGITKEFDAGKIVAVDDINIDVEDGEFITLVGPSGCGKTTTLRMIAGLETPTEGSIYINEDDVTDTSARHRDIAMVFQNYALYPQKTVGENMEFGLRMSTDLNSNERQDKIRWAAEMMGIEELLDDKPDELSGGQKQRVALGRAIVREPEVFLFDEPLSNLDAKLRTTMRAEIQRLQDELGITSVYVTHDQEEAMTMGDRIAILDDGNLQQIGNPIEVYNNPVNSFVGGFIGSPSMNFLRGLVSKKGEEIVLEGIDHEFEYPLSPEIYHEIGDDIVGEEVTLGARPEDIMIVNNGPTDSSLTSKVNVVEPLGDETYLYLSWSDDFIMRVSSDTEIESGDTIHFTFDDSHLHLFSKDGHALLTSTSEKRNEKTDTRARSSS
ncbi:ABC transporter ATP-binding protein [Haloarcula amylovorans]|uniref:ABC transporter ATP-binding protein n=1 Tax=Haloarcula amylovorans TaxID=2562280 RepID=UPI001076B3D7|nr:ABC transporter ATP-binding protein [Halomicroarcula amylolytica]